MKRVLVALALLAGRATGAAAQTPVPAGPEFVVTAPGDNCVFSKVRFTPGSGYVAAWEVIGAPGHIQARRYDADNRPLGAEFTVASSTANDQFVPAVAVARNGDFTIAWYERDAAGESHVRARRFDREGVPQGDDMHIGATDGVAPRVAYDARGNLIFVWSGASILGQRFDHDGHPLGAEFRVSSTTIEDQFEPSLAAAADGRFVVAWSRGLPSPSFAETRARRFAADGAPLGEDFSVAAQPSGNDFEPEVAMNDAGQFVVAWIDYGLRPWRVKVRAFDSAGTPAAPEIPMAPTSPNYEFQPVVAADQTGRFVVAWYGTEPDTGLVTVRAARIAAAGVPVGADFRADSTATTLVTAFLDVASDPSGNLIVAWTDVDGAVRGRRYGVLVPAALQVDAAAGPSSDGNGVWEPGEEVAFCPSWVNHSGRPRTVFGQLAELSGPPAAYAITDGSGGYGVMADQATVSCVDGYTVSVPAPATRPATHWDAFALETLPPDTFGPHTRWPLHLGGSFGDVPRSSPYYRFTETLLHRGVTAGCNSTSFCPQAVLPRQQMAVFALTSREGAGYAPPTCSVPPFGDVPVASGYCPWIAELARRGVMSGCGGGLFCPEVPVTRDQMAVILLRTLDPALDPPACTTPLFADVPAGSAYCRWIEELARRGITSGCGGGNYCPTSPVSREQMSVFLTTTFGLTLYGV